jgi:hypothetical protein
LAIENVLRHLAHQRKLRRQQGEGLTLEDAWMRKENFVDYGHGLD